MRVFSLLNKYNFIIPFNNNKSVYIRLNYSDHIYHSPLCDYIKCGRNVNKHNYSIYILVCQVFRYYTVRIQNALQKAHQILDKLHKTEYNIRRQESC
jgi:hypothetical protein